MKKALALGMLVLALAATGQAEGMKTTIYLGGGASMPSGPDEYTNGWNNGFQAGAGFGFIVSPSIEIAMSGYFNSFSVDEDGQLEMARKLEPDIPQGVVAEIDGGELTIFEFTGDLKWYLGQDSSAQFRPYLVGSLGTGAVKIADATIMLSYQGETQTVSALSTSESGTIYGFGAGFLLRMGSSAGLFVEGKWLSMSTKGDATTYMPIRGGLRIQLGR